MDVSSIPNLFRQPLVLSDSSSCRSSRTVEEIQLSETHRRSSTFLGDGVPEEGRLSRLSTSVRLQRLSSAMPFDPRADLTLDAWLQGETFVVSSIFPFSSRETRRAHFPFSPFFSSGLWLEWRCWSSCFPVSCSSELRNPDWVVDRVCEFVVSSLFPSLLGWIESLRAGC